MCRSSGLIVHQAWAQSINFHVKIIGSDLLFILLKNTFALLLQYKPRQLVGMMWGRLHDWTGAR